MNGISAIISRVKEATKEAIKVLRFGKDDVQTADQYLPFGIDSKPVKETPAIWLKTSDKGEPVIIGYYGNSDQTNPGEARIYATDSSGTEVFSMLFKNDGTVEFGGSDDFLMRFNNSKAVIDEIQQDIASLKQVFSSWVTAPNDGGAALKAASATWAGTPLQESIDNSKIEEIKTS